MEEFASALSGTRYYEPLKPYAASANPDFQKIDNALNLLNYRSKKKAFGESLSGAGRKEAAALYDTQADIENIMYIYRMKKLYGFSASEILPNLLPCSFRISKKTLLELAECADTDGIADRIAGTKYGFLFPKNRESGWETIHADYFYRIHRKNMRRSGDGAGIALSYLYLKEIDIKNIVMIIEGVRYSMPVDEIKSYLIGCG
jgi:V/A-type H+-transporting ATPase subunit C